MTVVRELARYILDLVGVQEVRWDKAGTARARDYTFFNGIENENHQLGTGFLVRQSIAPAVKKLGFVSEGMSYIVLRGRWCNIIVLKTHAPTGEENDDSKDRFNKELEQVFDYFPKHQIKILLGDFNAKSGREDIFKPTIKNKSLHEDSNNNGVRVVNFATYKNLVAKSTMFQHRNVHSPDGKTHNHIDHALKDRRWHSCILDVRSFRRAGCDTDHYSMVAKLRERLLARKQAA
jgi:hypothetical protein